MTVRHLRIFVQVYQCGGITRAAEQCHMTQPAVTRSIHELENYYSVCLFDRLNHRLTPTEAGKRLYAQALHLVDSFDALEFSLRNSDSAGMLRVGGSITIGNVLLPGLAKAFSAAYPAIRLQVTVNSGGLLEQALLDNELDLALIESTVENPQLRAIPFQGDRMVLVLPPNHPLAYAHSVLFEELAEYPLLMREKSSAGRSFLNSLFATRGIPMRPLWESASTQALLQAVAAGLGVSILPEKLAAEAVKKGQVVCRSFADESLEREYFIVYHQDKYLTPAMKALMALCKQT